MRLPEEPDMQGEINILPMIDVIFSILAFLIISTLYLTNSQGLDVDLPSATTSKTVSNEQVNVTIESDGEIFLNRKPIKIDNLQAALKELRPSDSETLVVINADEQVKHGRVVEVMDHLRQIEGVKLAIAAKKILE